VSWSGPWAPRSGPSRPAPPRPPRPLPSGLHRAAVQRRRQPRAPRTTSRRPARTGHAAEREIGGLQSVAGGHDLREHRAVTGRGPATAEWRHVVVHVDRADAHDRRVVGRAHAGGPIRAIVAGREDHRDVGRLQCVDVASNALLQAFSPAMSQEFETTSGASSVSGSPSGSRIHWNARWIALSAALPASLKIFAAIHLAPGATPIAAPLSEPPTMRPSACVP